MSGATSSQSALTTLHLLECAYACRNQRKQSAELTRDVSELRQEVEEQRASVERKTLALNEKERDLSRLQREAKLAADRG